MKSFSVALGAWWEVLKIAIILLIIATTIGFFSNNCLFNSQKILKIQEEILSCTDEET